MDIFRNGELIGHNYYFFTRKGDETIVTNQIKFVVKLFGATIFQVEGYGEEKYLKNQLISYESKTLQNNNFILNCFRYTNHAMYLQQVHWGLNAGENFNKFEINKFVKAESDEKRQ